MTGEMVLSASALLGGCLTGFVPAAGWPGIVFAACAGAVAGGVAAVFAMRVSAGRKYPPAVFSEGGQSRSRILQDTCDAVGIVPFRCDSGGRAFEASGAEGFWPFRDGSPVPVEEWLIPEDVAPFLAGWAELLGGKRKEILLEYRSDRSGSRRYFEMRVRRAADRDGGCTGIIRDVTDIKAGRAEVENTNFMFRNILDNLPGYVFVKDADDDFRYVQVNRKHHPLLGWHSEASLGMTDAELFPPDEAARYRRQDEEIARTGREFCGVSVFRDGQSVCYLKIFKQLLVRADGARLIVGIGIDVTHEHELELELEKNIEKLNGHVRDEQSMNRCLGFVSGSGDFDTVVTSFLQELCGRSEAARCFIFLYDEPSGTFLNSHEWSRTEALSLKGRLDRLDPRELGSFCDILNAHEEVVIQDALCPPPGLEALADKAVSYEIRSLLIAGIWREGRLIGFAGIDFVSSAHCFTAEESGSVGNACSLFLLAYERERRLREIEDSAAIHRQMIDNIPTPVILFDPDFNILSVNRNTCESTGLRESELVGSKCYHVLCNSDSPPEWCPMRETVKTRRSARVEFAGHGREYIVYTQPVFDRAGDMIHVLETALDVSEQQEQARRLSMQNLLLNNAAAVAKITYFTGNAEGDARIIGGSTGTGLPVEHSRSFRFEDWLIPEDRGEFSQLRTGIVSGEHDTLEMVCRSDAAGDRRSYRLVVTRDRNDRKLFIGVLLDISADIAMAAERQELIKSLNNYVENERIVNAGLSQIVLEEDFDRNVEEILRIIATQLDSDRAYFGVFERDGAEFRFCHEWLNDGVTSLKNIRDCRFYAQFPKWYGRFRDNELLMIPDIHHSEYADILREPGCRTLICAPIWVDRELCGILGVGFIRECREISELDQNIMRSAAKLIAISREHQIQRESFDALDRQNRMIIGSIQVPICLFDENGALIRCNPAAAALAGVSAEELSGWPCNRHLCGLAEVPEFCPVRNVISTGEPFSHEIRINGHECLVSAAPIRDRYGKILHVLENMIDMSEVNESRRQLEVAMRAAQAADKAKSAFLATMSHELRTPLNAVIGFSELLKAVNLPSAERDEYTQSINLAGNALLNLINDVLDLSKIEAEQMVIVSQPTEIEPLLREIMTVFQYKVQEKGLSLRLVVPPDLPVLEVDSQRLRQILLNLVGNAVKFTARGGILLTVAFTRRDAGKGHFSISVADTGIGIRAEAQERIFLPFVQQDAARDSRVFNGTGLGLTISQRLAVGMGGALRVESEPDKGSNFILELPEVAYAEAVKKHAAEPEETAELPLGPLRLLLVDDVPMNLRVLQAMVGKLGLECVCASSGAEALRVFGAGGPFAAVLTDLWMPEMNGTELAERIAASARPVPVIAVTADTQIAADLPGVFNGVLLKPITPDVLRKVIHGVLQNK